MRYIYLLLITIIFASCGNNKLRFVRNHSTKQKVVEIADVPSLKVKSEATYVPETTSQVSDKETITTSTSDTESKELPEIENAVFPEDVSNSIPKSVQDSTTVSSEEAQRIQNEARRAEKLGKASFNLSLMFFLFVIGVILALFIAFANNYSPIGFILAIIFGILAVASPIVSIILGANSLNAAYNTPLGRRRAITGIVISSVTIGLFLVNFLFGFF